MYNYFGGSLKKQRDFIGYIMYYTEILYMILNHIFDTHDVTTGGYSTVTFLVLNL